MFNFLASQIPGPIFCTPASLGHASVTGMSIGNLQYILLHDIHNLLCDLILKHESTSPEFVWGFQCSLLGSKIHYLGQEKSNSLHGSTQVVNIHYLGQNIITAPCDAIRNHLTLFWTGGGEFAPPPAGFLNIAQKPLGLGS